MPAPFDGAQVFADALGYAHPEAVVSVATTTSHGAQTELDENVFQTPPNNSAKDALAAVNPQLNPDPRRQPMSRW
jgi:hypothetical protein